MTKLLYAHILLDRSGSMETIRAPTIDAVNEYVAGLAADPNFDAAVSLSAFNSGHDNSMVLDLIIDGKPAKDLPKLTAETYEPNGGTPLNDAIGKTIQRMDSETHRPGESIALVIMTDGHENASREFSRHAIKALIETKQKAHNWLIVYLGANQDSFAEGTSARGTAAAQTMNFVPTSMGVASAMRSAGRATAAYAMAGEATMDSAFTDEERKQATS